MSAAFDNPAADPFAPLLSLPARLDPAVAEVWEPAAVAPSDPQLPRGASAMWIYRSPKGQTLCARVRFDRESGKDILPYCYGRRAWNDKKSTRRDVTAWRFKEPTKPLPLYDLDRLAAMPDAPVLLVEGEKTAEAAAVLFPDHVVTTSQGGSKAAGKSDWSALEGRRITIWPDADEAGAGYADTVIPLLRDAGAAFVRTVSLPSGLPRGWDLADDLPDQFKGENDAGFLRDILDAASPAASNVAMPNGFRMTSAGLHFHPEPKGDTATDAIFVAAAFEVVAETNDGVGLGWGVLIRWQDRDGRTHEWSVPRRLIHGDGREIAGELEDAGLSVGIRGVPHLRQFIGAVRTKRRLRCVDRTGWHHTPDGAAFILPGGHTFGAGARNVVFQSSRAASGREFATAGTLAEWQQQIAAYAVGNSRLVLFLAAAFAGPLLDVAGEQSGGVHLVGKSQSGKSTAALIAGSIWGRGDKDGQVRQWRGTSNGLEAVAAETSDTVLILDEIGQSEPREVGEIVYMLANNSGKQRAGRTGDARQPKSWRTFFLSTGEVTLSGKLAEIGKKAMAGQEVRLVNLPSDAGAGMGVFEDLHSQASPGALADHLREAARTYYGTASRAFLTALVRDRTETPDDLQSFIKGLRQRFEDENVPTASDGQVRSVAARFALIAAAGELATDYGVLPWEQGEAMAAAATCFAAWLAARGGVDAGEDQQAVSQVRAFIESHGEARFSLLGDRAPKASSMGFDSAPHEVRTINRAGFRRRVGTGNNERWEYLILPETWRNEVCKGLDANRAAKVLDAAGLLSPDQGKHLTKQVRLPDHGKLRVYAVRGEILEGAE